MTQEPFASRWRRWLRQIEETQPEELSCSDCFEQISDYVDLELQGQPADERLPGLRQHLHQCRVCRDEYVVLRDLARGIYPPLLADKGLGAALESQARKSPVPVSVETDGVGRYPQEAEAAVYFSCLEALQNVAKYAEASSATVRLAQSNGSLVFEVADDGRGFDTTSTRFGTGLQGIADRLSALDGELAIRSEPGSGTKVRGRIEVG